MPSPLYQDDLAAIQAEAFGGMAEAAAPEVVRLLRAAGIGSGRLLDIGCGAGVSTKCFSEAGFDVLAMEPSPALLKIARETAPEATFLEPVSAYDAALPEADAIVLMGEVLNYHDPADDADARVRGFFETCAAALRPGGMLVFDVIVAGEPPLDTRKWSSGKNWALMFEIRENDPPGWLVRHIQTFRETGAGYRRRREVHHARLFETSALRDWLEDAGFAVTDGPAYGDTRLLPRRRAFLARRA